MKEIGELIEAGRFSLPVAFLAQLVGLSLTNQRSVSR